MTFAGLKKKFEITPETAKKFTDEWKLEKELFDAREAKAAKRETTPKEIILTLIAIPVGLILFVYLVYFGMKYTEFMIAKGFGSWSIFIIASFIILLFGWILCQLLGCSEESS